jgi:hypothetical protein
MTWELIFKLIILVFYGNTSRILNPTKLFNF